MPEIRIYPRGHLVGKGDVPSEAGNGEWWASDPVAPVQQGPQQSYAPPQALPGADVDSQPEQRSFGDTVTSIADGVFSALGPSSANAAPATAQAGGGGEWWQADPVVPANNGATKVSTGSAPDNLDPGALGSFTRGTMNGLTFNFFDELSAVSKSGAGQSSEGQYSLGSLLSGLYKKVSGDPDFAKKFEEALATERGIDASASKNHPIANVAGNVTGALMLPVGGALNAATLPARMGRGAVVGAGMGAAYGAGAGDGMADRAMGAASGAAIGGAVGGFAPAVIEGVVRGARSFGTGLANTVRGIRNPDDEAARRVATSVRKDLQIDPSATSRLTPQEFAASAQNGGPATILDVGGETTRALARSAANTSPEGRFALNKTINERFEGQGDRVVGWLEKTFNFPDAHALQEGIKKAGSTINRPAYAKAYSDGNKVVLWDDDLSQLAQAPEVQSAIRLALPQLRNWAVRDGLAPPKGAFNIVDGRTTLRKTENGNEILPSLQLWDYVKRALDGVKTPTAQAFSRAIRDKLDEMVPSYATARSGAHAFFKAENALEAGQNFVSQNFANAEARSALAKMSEVERNLFQDGFVSRFIETINKTGDRRSVLNQIGESPAAREKLAIALGPEKAAQLEAGLRVEGVMDMARSAVQGNSTTARQLAELGLAGGTYGLGNGGDFTSLNGSALMNAALVYGAARGKARIDTNVAKRVAELLVSKDPQMLIRGIKIVTKNQQLFNSLRSFDQSVARIGASQTPGSGAAQMPAIGRANDQPEIPRPPGQ